MTEIKKCNVCGYDFTKKDMNKNYCPYCKSRLWVLSNCIDESKDVKEQMEFPDTFEEFVGQYGFKDKEEVYTNGCDLIPVFRVKQWLEHITRIKE